MGLFDKIKEPVFLKESNSAEEQLNKLKNLKLQISDRLLPQVERDIRSAEAGIVGENQIKYELANSHMPMMVLHDLYFEKDGYTAQIDYMIITRGRNFILECKNLIGNINIDSGGNFTRKLPYVRFPKEEGIYSPITQNQRHMELIKMIRMESKGNILTKALFDRNFSQQYRSIVVLANPKTVLNARYASKDVKSQVIRADQLIAYIKKVNSEKDAVISSEKEMLNLAQFFLDHNKKNPKDYLEKYKNTIDKGSKNDQIELTPENNEEITESAAFLNQHPIAEDQEIHNEPVPAENQLLCPKCGAVMIRRTALKGMNAGNEFYGCSNFPKCRSTVNIT